MKLTIIIPLYNSFVYFDRIILTLSPYFNDETIEIIFVDDFSSDDCIHKINEYIKENFVNNIIILKNKSNRGPAYSRNKGLRHSKGEYIVFLDSDDSWHPQKLDIQLDLMKKKNILICGTNHEIINDDDLFKNKKINYLDHDIFYKYIKWPLVLFKSPFATPSVIIHHSLKEYVFNESLWYAEDYNLWIRIVHKYPAIKITLPLTYTFKHDYYSDNSLSSNLWEMQRGANKNYISLLKNKYNFVESVLIFSALMFSQVKFLRRLVGSIFFLLKNLIRRNLFF